MVTKKKTTVKHYINVRIEDRAPRYPLYFMVTYDRKTTHVKSRLNGYFKTIEEAMDQSEKEIAREVELVQKLVEMELAMTKEDAGAYMVKGLSSRYDAYAIALTKVVDSFLKFRLAAAAQRCNEPDYLRMIGEGIKKEGFDLCYRTCARLFDDLHNHLDGRFMEDVQCFHGYMSSLQDEPCNELDHVTLIDLLHPELTQEDAAGQNPNVIFEATPEGWESLLQRAMDHYLGAYFDSEQKRWRGL